LTQSSTSRSYLINIDNMNRTWLAYQSAWPQSAKQPHRSGHRETATLAKLSLGSPY